MWSIFQQAKWANDERRKERMKNILRFSFNFPFWRAPFTRLSHLFSLRQPLNEPWCSSDGNKFYLPLITILGDLLQIVNSHNIINLSLNYVPNASYVCAYKLEFFSFPHSVLKISSRWWLRERESKKPRVHHRNIISCRLLSVFPLTTTDVHLLTHSFTVCEKSKEKKFERELCEVWQQQRQQRQKRVTQGDFYIVIEKRKWKSKEIFIYHFYFNHISHVCMYSVTSIKKNNLVLTFRIWWIAFCLIKLPLEPTQIRGK